MIATKKLLIDASSFKGIKRGERQKTALENNGWSYITTQRAGIDKWVVVYQKNE